MIAGSGGGGGVEIKIDNFRKPCQTNLNPS